MKLVKPVPFTEAIEKIGTKTIIGSQLNSAEWSEVPLALRERAFFSARVESARFLQRAQDSIGDFLAGNREDAPDGTTMLKTGGRAEFVRQLQEFALANGMGPLAPGEKGTLKDISSEKRLSLIFDTQTRQGQDYGYWKQGMDADVLNEFPAQRFIRVEHVHEPRDWHKLFEDGVWLKTDIEAWTRINQDFGVPWGPWGWGCGHDVEDVDRDEAEQLGLIEPGARPESAEKSFNDRLEATVRGLNEEVVQQLRSAFGDQIEVQGDTVRWSGKTSQKETKVTKSVPHPAEGEGDEESSAKRLDESLSIAGVRGKEKVTAVEMAALREELKEIAPVKVKDVLGKVTIGPGSLVKREDVERWAQWVLDFLPPAVVAKLPKLQVSTMKTTQFKGQYRGGGQLMLNDGLSGFEDAQATVMHELMHWVHFEGPRWYRDLIKKHFEARTAGEAVKQLPGYPKGIRGKKDKWADPYSGRVYDFETGDPMGTEVATTHLEWLAQSPEEIAKLWANPEFRETLLIVLRGIF